MMLRVVGGVYELPLGKQPTVGAGLPRPPPMYRPVAPWSSSKRRPIMSFNTFIRVCSGFPPGRYIGAGLDTSAPTVGWLIASKHCCVLMGDHTIQKGPPRHH